MLKEQGMIRIRRFSPIKMLRNLGVDLIFFVLNVMVMGLFCLGLLMRFLEAYLSGDYFRAVVALLAYLGTGLWIYAIIIMFRKSRT